MTEMSVDIDRVINFIFYQAVGYMFYRGFYFTVALTYATYFTHHIPCKT